MELIDLESGGAAWSVSEEAGGFYQVTLFDPAADRVLLQGPTSRQMRILSNGELIWEEPSKKHRAAAPIPGTDLIAVSDEVSWQEDVIRILERETGKERRRFLAGDYVRDVAATADGTRIIATVRGDRWQGVRVWTVDSGELEREIELAAQPRSLLPLQDPDLVAVDDFSQNLRILDLRTGEELRRIAHMAFADDVFVTPNGERAVTLASSSLRFWDTRQGVEIAHRVTHGNTSAVSIDPNGEYVAYLTTRPRKTEDGTEFKAAVIWRPEGGDQPRILPVEDVHALGFDPTGRYLVLNGRGRFARVVDARTLGTKLTVRPLRLGKINDLWFASNGDLLLVREQGRYQDRELESRRFSLRAFGIKSGEELSRVDVGRSGIHPVPGSSEVLFVDQKRRWRRFDPSGVTLDPVLAEEWTSAIRAAPFSSRVLAESYSGSNLVHDLSAATNLRLTTGEEPFNVRAAALDPSGRYVALSLDEREWRADSGGEILVLDAASGDELARLRLDRYFYDLAFVDGGEAVILSELRGHLPEEADHQFLHWNWRKNEMKVLVDDNPVRYLAATRDGARFATAEGNRHPDSNKRPVVGKLRIRVWRGEDGTEILRSSLDSSPTRIALSGDGSYVAVATLDRVSLLRVDDGAEVAGFGTDAEWMKTEQRHTVEADPRLVGGGNLIDFAASGRILVIAELNGALLYDIPSGATHRLRHVEAVSRLAVSADGGFLAIAGKRFVSVWDIGSREQVVRFEAPEISELAFSGETGHELLGLRGEKLIRFRWHPDELWSLACAAFGNGDWRPGRARVIQETGSHPCDAETKAASKPAG
jgi:WD40 repeat protein